MESARHPFPVSSTARTIGEQKAKVKVFQNGVVGQFEMRPNWLLLLIFVALGQSIQASAALGVVIDKSRHPLNFWIQYIQINESYSHKKSSSLLEYVLWR